MKKFLVIGNPIAHSLSPKLFTLFFKKLDLHDYLYEKFLITNIHELEMFVSRLDNDVAGFNVTSPYKVEIIKYLDYLDSSVINTNNCNCVKIINNRLYGYNTDYFGFKSLINYYSLNFNNCDIVILGSGGTAHTLTALLLKEYSSNIYIYSRNNITSLKLIDFSSKYINKKNSISQFKIDNQIDCSKSIIINCTTDRKIHCNNFFNNNIPIKKCKLFIDLNYNFNKNQKYINGNTMFIYQAIQSLNIWFDKKLLSKFKITELIKELSQNEKN